MNDKTAKNDLNLRQRAELMLDTSSEGDLAPDTTLERKQLLHELLVHQAELEMQNEELRSAHAQLDASRARYFNLYDLAPVGYLTLNSQRLIEECNLFAATMLGVNQKTVCKTPVSKILLKEDQSIFYLNLSASLESGLQQQFEMRLLRANSGVFWGLIQVISIHDGNYWLTVTDISDSKQAEKKLQESDSKFRSVFEQASLGVARFSLKGDWLEVNKKLCDIVGFTQEEFLVKPSKNITHAEDLEQEQLGINQLLNSEIRTYSGAKRVYNSSGDIIWVKETMSLVRNISDDPSYFISIIEDITEQKSIEAKQKSLTEQLHQAQKMEGIGQLAGGIAHDFNNMLGVIIGHCELAMKKLLQTDPLIENLEAILKAANHSAELTRQLLTFARKQTIEPKVLNLNASVSAMTKILKRLIGESIHLSWRPTEDLWLVKVDPTQIDQMLVNLCVNARDAIAGKGQVYITVTNCTIDEQYSSDSVGDTGSNIVSNIGSNTVSNKICDIPLGEYVKLSVSDNGCGMDEGTMSHIFEPFFTTKALGSGTGLGLSSIFGSIKMNAGFIDVSSQLDKGTRFDIYFHKTELPLELEQEITEDFCSKDTQTILLVEDEKSLLEIQGFVLRRGGYKVLAASTAEQADELFTQHLSHIDLLLTDVVMPNISGIELAEKLQSKLPTLKVIFMSGYPADGIGIQNKLEAGAHFLQKPFSMQDLTRKVGQVLSTK